MSPNFGTIYRQSAMSPKKSGDGDRKLALWLCQQNFPMCYQTAGGLTQYLDRADIYMSALSALSKYCTVFSIGYSIYPHYLRIAFNTWNTHNWIYKWGNTKTSFIASKVEPLQDPCRLMMTTWVLAMGITTSRMAIANRTCVSFCNQPKAHFGLPWEGYAPGTIAVNAHGWKENQCLSNASQHVSINGYENQSPVFRYEQSPRQSR